MRAEQAKSPYRAIRLLSYFYQVKITTMSAAARALINRENAQASTGPKTQFGKEVSKMNALGHGMASKTVVLPHESAEEYQQMHRGFIDSYNPANEREKQLVELIAQSFWRLQRCYGVERAFLENRIAASGEEDPDAAMANLFIDKAEANRMRLLMRYITAAERAHNKALADLHKAQGERRKQEREEAAHRELAALYTAPVKASNGFVSQGDVQTVGHSIAMGASHSDDDLSDRAGMHPERSLAA
jgi:hypothetical protein